MKILQIIKIIKIMAKFLLISLLVLGLGIYSGCGSDGTGTGAGGPGGAGGGGGSGGSNQGAGQSGQPGAGGPGGAGGGGGSGGSNQGAGQSGQPGAGGSGGGAGGGGAAAPPPLLATVYVDGSASDGGDGSSWKKAYKTLQAGINAAASKVSGNGYVRVHVAVGTYKPTSCPDQANAECADGDDKDRKKHFALKNNVEVVGGYTGLGNTKDEDPSKTILSGDLAGDDTNERGEHKDDNVYHVFYHPEAAALAKTAKLENVTITKGNAAGTSDIDQDGGGMYNNNSSPELINVKFEYNEARYYGGGMSNVNNSSPTLTDVTFTKNYSDGVGGAMYSDSSSNPTLTRVTGTGGTTLTPSTSDNGNNAYHKG